MHFCEERTAGENPEGREVGEEAQGGEGYVAGAHPLKRFNKKGKKGSVLIIMLILNKIICMEWQHSLIFKRAGSEASLAWIQILT